MDLLLDTHIVFWSLRGSQRLQSAHKALIEDRQRLVYVSAASGWEIAVKVGLGKWLEAAPLLPNLTRAVVDAGLLPLPITLSQAERAGSFDVAHKDPFDRLLAAQALDLDLTLVTVDPAFAQFGCKVA